MDLEQKQKIALFRFGVIHPLVSLKDSELVQKEALIREAVAHEWDIPYSGRSRVCRATIQNWVKRYKDSGNNLESLFPKDRVDAGRARKLDEETEKTLVNLKNGHPTASLPTLLRLAQSRGFLPPDFKASPQTIYRVFQKHGLHVKQLKQDDSRKFQAELPNDLWQSDCMHGPLVTHSGKSHKAYLFAIIDDCSRLITHAQFYLHENIEAYVHCLQTALAKRGLPRKLYLDNGAAFRSHQLQYSTASLGIALIHARPYRPQGKGKIERWFKTVQMIFLPTLPAELTLEQLNERLFRWINEEYHKTVHSVIKQTPFDCYSDNLHLIRKAPDNLSDHFRKQTKRRVNKDRTVSLNGRDYEAPLGLMGKTVTLRYHDSDLLRIEVFDNEKSMGFLSPLNPQINVSVKRDHITTYKTEVSKIQTSDSQIKYSGGKLFEGGNNHASL